MIIGLGLTKNKVSPILSSTWGSRGMKFLAPLGTFVWSSRRWPSFAVCRCQRSWSRISSTPSRRPALCLPSKLHTLVATCLLPEWLFKISDMLTFVETYFERLLSLLSHVEIFIWISLLWVTLPHIYCNITECSAGFKQLYYTPQVFAHSIFLSRANWRKLQLLEYQVLYAPDNKSSWKAQNSSYVLSLFHVIMSY